MTPRIAAQEAFKLALSMVLLYALALWMGWDMPGNGGLAIILVSLGSTGASLQKGAMRIAGTTLGLIVGLFVLGTFSQDRWLALGFFCLYILVIGYVIQSSRYGYAWYVAGFLPALVWASTYGQQNLGAEGFSYASFRYLETTSGILIYTLVCALVWPRNAGQQLAKLGTGFWKDLRTQFGGLLRELREGGAPDGSAGLRSRLAGTLGQMLTTLDAAYADTPAVIIKKRTWERLRVEVRMLSDALNLWGECLEDVRRLDLPALVPGLEAELTRLDSRFERIEALGQAVKAPPGDTRLDEETADPQPMALDIDQKALTEIPRADRAALMCFLQQLEILDRSSRDTVLALRVLAEFDATLKPDSGVVPPDLKPAVLWAPERLVKALFPALCFAVAFIFWICVDPPAGPKIPSTTVAIALTALMSPLNPYAMLGVFLGSLWFAVAPVYCLLMPAISTGPELMTLIFVYTFVFGYLGGKRPVLKLIPILLFVEMTGISNSQTYSFVTMVNGSMGLFFPLCVIALVDMFWTPSRPEKLLLVSMKRFFRGCSRVMGGFAPRQPGERDRGRALRTRYYRNMVQPTPGQMELAAAQLGKEHFKGYDPAVVASLIANLQSIGFRIQALELAHQRLANHAGDFTEMLGAPGARLREQMERIFDRWARLEKIDALDDERAGFQQIRKELEARLDAMEHSDSPDANPEQTPRDLYALISCLRGLLKAMARTQEALKPIDFQRWAAARF